MQLKGKLTPFLGLILALSVSFTACDKKDPADPKDPQTQTQTPVASDPTPQPADADAVVVAIQQVTYQNAGGFPMTISTGLGVAMFNDGSGTYLDAGTVTIDGEHTLIKESNNVYRTEISQSQPMGIDFASDVNWEWTGGPDFPAQDLPNTQGWPSDPKLQEVPATVNTNESLTLELEEMVDNADTIYFNVYGGTDVLMKALPGNTTSHTFTAEEMKTVGTGTGFIQIAPYNMLPRSRDGKTIYMINEKVLTEMVEFE